MLRHYEYTKKRLASLLPRLRDNIYPEKRAIESLFVSPQVDRIPYAEAVTLNYRPAKLGEQYGPLWATYWFKASATIPEHWKNKRVDLLWISHSEATLWIDGRSVQGLNKNQGDRPDAILFKCANGGETVELYIEMACNGKFGERNNPAAKHVSPYVLDQCDLAIFDPEAWELYYDFLVLQELEAEKEHGLDPSWAGLLLSELNRFANIYNDKDRSTWPEARLILEKLYKHKNGTCAHELSAIGHAHIDTAWLWPLAETWRKCERTFSTATAYMEDYPEYKFSCSQAYQYEIIKNRNPDLYERIKARVKTGQWVPVGGTWIEPDCNIPSGEALVRQFLYGQRYFENEFGLRCREFWNPDVFGYNGQLPQIMQQAGIRRFLTQKLSWNHFNKPMHHTFLWQGIDGSEVLAHFPPADTYNATCEIKQLRFNVKNYKDHDRSRHSMLLFGHGDGGGGPTRHMLEILIRAQDLQGLPRTTIRSSDAFFAALEADCSDYPRMVGELYFELHRGTYTTQARTKYGNRKSEFLLQGIEFLSAIAMKIAQYDYPAAEIERLWKIVCLNQFHDILPGSSIALVYEDAARDYAEVARTGQGLQQKALNGLKLVTNSKVHAQLLPVNTTGFIRREIADTDNGSPVSVVIPPHGVGKVVAAQDSVKISKLENGSIALENEHLKAQIGADGKLLSLYDKNARREALAEAGNIFELYDDKPIQWEAWDVDPFHLETGKPCTPGRLVKLEQKQALNGPAVLRVDVSFEQAIGTQSILKQRIRLDACSKRLEFHTEIDWQESQAFLKVAFPVNVRSMHATYEMQYGNVERPTHFNTTHDLARYEVPGHKWADLSEHGFGVALLTDCKYGYSTLDNTMRISLLRAPKSPDPGADRGLHTFKYAIYPHSGGWRDGGVVAESYRFNVPVLWTQGTIEPQCYFESLDPNLVLDTVKKAEDSDALVLRLFEAHGARGTARIWIGLPFSDAVRCNFLEDKEEALAVDGREIVVPYKPYQIISILLK